MWAKAGTRETVNTRITLTFNRIVFIDLVHFEEQVYLFMVDDAIRFTVIEHLEFKDPFFRFFHVRNLLTQTRIY